MTDPRQAAPLDRADSLSDPIDFIRKEHDDQFEICAALDDLFNLLNDARLPAQVSSLRDFLTQNLPRHIQDEESDLFPALRRRGGTDGGMPAILDQLAAEHEMDKDLLEPLVQELDAILESGSPKKPLRFFMDVRAFVEIQRRHLLWENRIVLPMAEELLTADDKKELAERFAARRGRV